MDRVEDTTVIFKTSTGASVPKPVKTELYDLKYLGPLRAARATDDDTTTPPYFLFSARPCKSCLQDTGIYAIRPTAGKPSAYLFPGKILDAKTRALTLESRAFFGRCLSRQLGAVYLVFQKERIDRRHGLMSSVLIAEPGPDHMDERLLERHLPSLQDTLRLVKAKSCQEIEGRNRQMSRKPVDINARHGVDLDKDTDDSNDVKENQTDDLSHPDSGT